LRSNLPVFALPFPLLRHLQLRRAQFYGLLLTFALGAITIAVSLGRFISTEVGKSWNAVYIWSMIQMTVAIIVVSLPALKSLLRRRNMSSNKSRSGTGTRTTNGYSSNYSVRARKKISGALPDDTGSDVELNRIVVKDGSIVKTNEVSIDSRPASEERSFSIV
jgi:hypothetical protein